jgi:8-oxo-dGTP diphosphatase
LLTASGNSYALPIKKQAFAGKLYLFMTMKQLAGCVIVDESGKVLLIHRNTPRLTQWELPGGKVEPGEALPDTVAREALEEIGVRIRVGGELGSTRFEDNGTNWEYHWFRAKIISGQPAAQEPDKHDDVAYFDLLDPVFPTREIISVNIVALISFIKNSKMRL